MWPCLLRANAVLVHCASLPLPQTLQTTAEAAHRMYMLALDKGITRGKPVLHVAASMLYIACRRAPTPHLLIDFSEALRVDVFTLAKTYSQFVHAMNLPVNVIDPSIYVERFAGKLGLGEDTHAVSNTALRMLSRMRKDWITTGRHPAGLFGVSLLIAARVHGYAVEAEQVLNSVRVADATLRARLAEFENTAASFLSLPELNQAPGEADPPAFVRATLNEAQGKLRTAEALGLLEYELPSSTIEAVDMLITNSNLMTPAELLIAAYQDGKWQLPATTLLPVQTPPRALLDEPAGGSDAEQAGADSGQERSPTAAGQKRKRAAAAASSAPPAAETVSPVPAQAVAHASHSTALWDQVNEHGPCVLDEWVLAPLRPPRPPLPPHLASNPPKLQLHDVMPALPAGSLAEGDIIIREVSTRRLPAGARAALVTLLAHHEPSCHTILDQIDQAALSDIKQRKLLSTTWYAGKQDDELMLQALDAAHSRLRAAVASINAVQLLADGALQDEPAESEPAAELAATSAAEKWKPARGARRSSRPTRGRRAAFAAAVEACCQPRAQKFAARQPADSEWQPSDNSGNDGPALAFPTKRPRAKRPARAGGTQPGVHRSVADWGSAASAMDTELGADIDALSDASSPRIVLEVLPAWKERWELTAEEEALVEQKAAEAQAQVPRLPSYRVPLPYDEEAWQAWQAERENAADDEAEPDYLSSLSDQETALASVQARRSDRRSTLTVYEQLASSMAQALSQDMPAPGSQPPQSSQVNPAEPTAPDTQLVISQADDDAAASQALVLMPPSELSVAGTAHTDAAALLQLLPAHTAENVGPTQIVLHEGPLDAALREAANADFCAVPEEQLTDVAEEEIDALLLPPSEAAKREDIWNRLYKEYMAELEQRAKTGGRRGKKRVLRRDLAADTPSAAVSAMPARNRPSSKINKNVHDQLRSGNMAALLAKLDAEDLAGEEDAGTALDPFGSAGGGAMDVSMETLLYGDGAAAAATSEPASRAWSGGEPGRRARALSNVTLEDVADTQLAAGMADRAMRAPAESLPAARRAEPHADARAGAAAEADAGDFSDDEDLLQMASDEEGPGGLVPEVDDMGDDDNDDMYMDE